MSRHWHACFLNSASRLPLCIDFRLLISQCLLIPCPSSFNVLASPFSARGPPFSFWTLPHGPTPDTCNVVSSRELYSSPPFIASPPIASITIISFHSVSSPPSFQLPSSSSPISQPVRFYATRKTPLAAMRLGAHRFGSYCCASSCIMRHVLAVSDYYMLRHFTIFFH